MKHATRILAVILATAAVPFAKAADKQGDGKVSSPLDFKMKAIDGKETDLSQYKGKVVLVVNVASQCGNTKQYAALEKMYETHAKEGLVIIGVPANEFGGQEPGSDEEIAKFCTSKYKVTFPMMSKVVVKGEGISPLYKFLTSKDSDPKFAGDITWNFEKFLIGRDGKVVARFKPGTKPESEEITKAVAAELEKK